MARRVIEGQVDVFEVLREGSEGGATSSDPPQAAAHLPLKGKAFGGAEDDSATRTSSVNAFGVATFPIGEGLGKPARVLTLAEIENLEPFRALVWIEILDDGPGATTNPARAFLRLFQATFQTVGIPYKTERKHYHFKYTYTNGRNYYHWRIGEFYGQTWRVWDKCPTDKQREETPWIT